MKIAFILIIFTFFVSGCLPKKSVINVQRDLPIKLGASAISVSTVAIAPDQKQLTLTGQNLNAVTAVTITGPSVNKSFDIDAKSTTSLTISAVSAGLKLIGSTLYSIVLSTAQGDATIPVEFAPSQLGATTGQVLKWNGTAWVASDLDALTYAGTWDATNVTTPNATPVPGEYYIVSVAGSGFDARSWEVGDWIIYNDNTAAWDKISNSVVINPGSIGTTELAAGAVTDAKVSDVNVSKITSGAGNYFTYAPAGTACAIGEILKLTANGWECAIDDNTGGVTSITAGTANVTIGGTASVPTVSVTESDPTVTAFAKAALPTCTAGQVLKSDGTTLSCVTDNTVSDTTLSEVQVEGYIANDVTTNYLPFDNGTKLVDSNLYQNGLVMEVAAGRDFCINGGNCLSAMSATVGTVTNVTVTPPLAVATGTTTPALSLTLPTCGVGEVLKSDGSNFSCVTDIGSAGADAVTIRGENTNPTLATDTTTDGQILVWSQTNSRWEVGTQTTDTNTNAQTICTGATFLDGNGACTAMTVDTTLTIGTAATEVMGADAVPNCLASEKLSMSAGPVFTWSCIADVDTDTNTNAGTLCVAGQYLDGDGTCKAIPVDTDTNTNAQTICTGATFLDGNGACTAMTVDTNTNAGTICTAGQYLDGDGTCKAIPVDTTLTIGTAATEVMGADAVPNCLASEKLSMSAGPVFTWSCIADVDTDTNTNAGTLCVAGQYLDGDGTCKAIPVDTDTNAQTICTGATFLDGNGACTAMTVDTDTQLSEATVEGYIGNDVTANYVAKGNGTKLVTSQIFDNGTNVGIGTATPGAKLDVNGEIKASSFRNAPVAQTVKGLTWSRIVDLNENGTLGTSFFITISGTRTNVVWNSTWHVNTSHSFDGYLTLVSSTEYSQARLRLVIDTNGGGFLEFYDEATGAVLGTNQTINITINNLIGTSAILTAFQDGTDSTGFTVMPEVTSIPGGLIAQGGIKLGTAIVTCNAAHKGTMRLNGDNLEVCAGATPTWVGLGTSASPIGSIIPFGGTVVPSGYLECNGAQISRTTYANLFNAIGTVWGTGDGSTTFHLPDMRGRFLRGQNSGSGNDPDAATRTACNTGGATGDSVGSCQADELKSHDHNLMYRHTNPTFPTGGGDAVAGANSASGTFADNGNWIGNTGGSESRPKNANVKYIIKYAHVSIGTDGVPANNTVGAAQVIDGSITASDLDTDYVDVAGDTMTGALNLPASGLKVNTSDLVVNTGKVGIGTATPTEKLDIEDGSLELTQTTATVPMLKLNGQAAATVPSIRIHNPDNAANPYVWLTARDNSLFTVEGAAVDGDTGTVYFQVEETGRINAPKSMQAGTSTINGTGTWQTVTFPSPFASTPSITANMIWDQGTSCFVVLKNITTTSFQYECINDSAASTVHTGASRISWIGIAQ